MEKALQCDTYVMEYAAEENNLFIFLNGTLKRLRCSQKKPFLIKYSNLMESSSATYVKTFVINLINYIPFTFSKS